MINSYFQGIALERHVHKWLDDKIPFYYISCVCVCVCAQSCLTLWPTRLLCPWDSPGKNTGVGCHFLLQGNLPNPGIEPVSLVSPELASGFFATGATWEVQYFIK